MSARAGLAGIEELPPILPIFPLAGVLLLPRGRLPLNIFEPRYLAMVRDALASGRTIGMVQPLDPASREPEPAVYPIGCAGRITGFTENDDGRFQITLTGISRFRIREELSRVTPYRKVIADYDDFTDDLEPPPHAGDVNRNRLAPALRSYLELHGLSADWQAIEKAPAESLINALAMICPFTPPEKQALLEARDIGDRADMMIALLEMAVAARPGAPETKLQ
ncbi:LON peptidase substrate-binding domain-containing protein [Zavarzinia sp.]|uniref:LON peptidase substrate-binding domain-containing protein n=1 Tax=Zavarzinia sp. TaxID=2027920 RepID=UPI003BB5A1AE|nr:LON peptidase substrate-binding domain-containing protein [Zavarzinia sp.]